MSNQVTINADQALYVITCGTGYSCLGFDVCLDRAMKYAQWLTDRGVAATAPDRSRRGRLDAFEQYRALIAQVRDVCAAGNVRCDAELTPQLNGLEKRRIEVVDKWGERRRFVVGMSLGFIPIHLELANRRSLGGSGVLGAPFQSVRRILAPS